MFFPTKFIIPINGEIRSLLITNIIVPPGIKPVLPKISKTPVQYSPAQWPKILVQSSTKLCQHRKFSKFPAQKDTICLNFSSTVLAQLGWKTRKYDKNWSIYPEILPKMIKNAFQGWKFQIWACFLFFQYKITQKSLILSHQR